MHLERIFVAVNCVLAALKVIVAPMKVKLKQIVGSVQIAALDAYSGHVAGRYATHDHGVTIVGHIELLRRVVVVEYERF